MNNTYKISDISPKRRKHQEWTPAPGVDMLLSPLFRGILGAFRITKWLQICQIALVVFSIFFFLFPNSKQGAGLTFSIVFSSVLGAVHLLQLLVGGAFRKKANAELTHYSSYLFFGAGLPEGEIARQREIADVKDEAGLCVRSSVFGIILCSLIALSAFIVDEEIHSLDSFVFYLRVYFFGFLFPALGVWAWVHYQEIGALTFLGLIACGAVDYWLGFPVAPILLLAIGVYLMLTSRAVVALRFFAVYVCAILLFLGVVALFFSTPRGVNMSVFAYMLAACLLPSVLQLVLYVCFRNSTVEVKEEGAEQPVLHLKRTRIMDFLYTYVWGGLSMLVCFAGLIVNLCNDKYNLMNYTKHQLDFKPTTLSSAPKPIGLRADVSAYSRHDNLYSNSYGSSSSDASYSSRRFQRYDDESPRRREPTYRTSDYERERNDYHHNEYDYSSRSLYYR